MSHGALPFRRKKVKCKHTAAPGDPFDTCSVASTLEIWLDVRVDICVQVIRNGLHAPNATLARSSACTRRREGSQVPNETSGVVQELSSHHQH